MQDTTVIRENPESERACPIYVDIDGTLIKTDLLVESALRLALRNPLYVFAMLLWLIRGKAVLKHEIARRVRIDVAHLPYHAEFIEWLRLHATNGRALILASASHESYVKGIASHLGFFTDTMGSTNRLNMAGKNKLAAIKAHSAKQPFDYAGNARPDLPIWQEARHAIVVNPDSGIESAARSVASVQKVFHAPQAGLKVWLKAIRIHQWLKNLLIGVPLLTAFQFQNPVAVLHTAVAIIAFGLVASATYLMNDLMDLDSDRRHPRKKNRPLASGQIGILQAVTVGLLILAGGLTLAATVSLAFLASVIVYLVATLSYSWKLKRYMLIDVLCLGGLYTWRIIAGAIAIGAEISNWLAAFSMFMFLSLALVKRCAELVSLAEQSRQSAQGRDYRVTDTLILTALGVASGCSATLVLALFIESPNTIVHYGHPRLLWLLCPLLLYWVSRIWVKTARGEMHDDPIVYAARDRASWVIFGSLVLITLLAHL